MIHHTLQRLRAAAAAHRHRKPALAASLLALATSAPALAFGLITPPPVPPPAAAQAELFTLADDGPPTRIVGWEGQDLDGDGAGDIVNPTGQVPRGHDAYGEGAFGASRDGGGRHHLGVDYVSAAGQAVVAPISGFVSKVGFPYADDARLRYVQIDNPALRISARVFYVDPQVVVGQAVRLGTPIGVAQTLQARYPGGITDHVHLEVADGRGRKLDAASLIHPHYG